MAFSEIGLFFSYLKDSPGPDSGVHDAPGPAELVIAIGASTTTQAHHRIGNRYADEKEMGLK